MITVYKTKRDVNGNTKKLVLDHGKKLYAREYGRWSVASEAVEIKTRDLRRLEAEAAAAGYSKVDVL